MRIRLSPPNECVESGKFIQYTCTDYLEPFALGLKKEGGGLSPIFACLYSPTWLASLGSIKGMAARSPLPKTFPVMLKRSFCKEQNNSPPIQTSKLCSTDVCLGFVRGLSLFLWITFSFLFRARLRLSSIQEPVHNGTCQVLTRSNPVSSCPTFSSPSAVVAVVVFSYSLKCRECDKTKEFTKLRQWRDSRDRNPIGDLG